MKRCLPPQTIIFPASNNWNYRIFHRQRENIYKKETFVGNNSIPKAGSLPAL
jgi:hypothetical protein